MSNPHAPAQPVHQSGVRASPSDASSRHKGSDASYHKDDSSDTSLSAEETKFDVDDDTETLLEVRKWLATSDDSGKVAEDYDQHRTVDRYQEQRAPPPKKPRLMHQTSSKLLRMTENDRPYEKDIKDLFATLMVSLPLTAHRVRFTRVEHTFTTEEAIINLGSLKFSQANRMPDPKDPTRIVSTTTTLTFSMAQEMARSVCQRFLDARFVESVDGKTDFSSRSSVWQISPKGMCVLQRFCQRCGIHQRHINQLLDSPRNMMQLVMLERDHETDKLHEDAATISVIFRRFAGDTGPNVKSSSTHSESDSMTDYSTGLIGVKIDRSRRVAKDTPYTFSGKSAYDWLLDCTTVVDKREVFELANLFLLHGYIEHAGDDRSPTMPQRGPNASAQNEKATAEKVRFSASKHVSFAITQKGMQVAGWVKGPKGIVNNEATLQRAAPAGINRDSNTNRMTVILRDPALRLLFREYLRETHCEENLAFYLDATAFLRDYAVARRGGPSQQPRLDTIRETLASAYSLYNAFLAPGSPCELNIDHTLRNALSARMTRTVGEDDQMIRSLDEVASLFDQAQSSVFKLMASDSVPKFSREPRYESMLQERNIETLVSNVSLD